MTAAFPAHLRADLDNGLRALGLAPALSEPLLAYLALLERWNRSYNLTAIRDPQQMVSHHLLDSLAMRPYLSGIESLADLGSGAGLPGIPLAIALPALRVTLVESNGKKARFLREALRHLGLANARVAQSRAEALDEPGAFDAITARALAPLAGILAVGAHLLTAEGRLLAMKGMHPAAEVAALPPGWRLQAAHALDVPGLDAQRHLLVIGRDDQAIHGLPSGPGPTPEA